MLCPREGHEQQHDPLGERLLGLEKQGAHGHHLIQSQHRVTQDAATPVLENLQPA